MKARAVAGEPRRQHSDSLWKTLDNARSILCAGRFAAAAAVASVVVVSGDTVVGSNSSDKQKSFTFRL